MDNVEPVEFQPAILKVNDYEEAKKDEFIGSIENYLVENPTNRLILWFENYFSGTYCSNCGGDIDNEALRGYYRQIEKFAQQIAELFFINVSFLFSKDLPKFIIPINIDNMIIDIPDNFDIISFEKDFKEGLDKL